MGTENEFDIEYVAIGAFNPTNKFVVFENEKIVKGHFMLSDNGTLYKTIFGITFKVKHPEKYEVRFIAEQVD